MLETFLGQRICSYVGELESLGQEWKYKPRAQIKSSKKDSSKKNDPEEVMQWFSSFWGKVLFAVLLKGFFISGLESWYR